MRRIEKGPPPPALVAYCRTEGATFKDLRKAPLQERLCQVQHYLCCFCQSRIEPNGHKMRIAHFVPQSDKGDGAARSLDWDNHWGACCGGEEPTHLGRPTAERAEREEPHGKRFHCDKRQAERLIDARLDPGRFVAGDLRYHNDGTIDAADPELMKSIDDVLGLNIPKLKNYRVQAKEHFKQHVRERRLSPSQIERLIETLEASNQTRWPEYLDYVLWFLRRLAHKERGIRESLQS